MPDHVKLRLTNLKFNIPGPDYLHLSMGRPQCQFQMALHGGLFTKQNLFLSRHMRVMISDVPHLPVPRESFYYKSMGSMGKQFNFSKMIFAKVYGNESCALFGALCKTISLFLNTCI